MSEPMIILCDIDNTILNTEQAVVDTYNEIYKKNITLDDVTSWDYFKDKVTRDFFLHLSKPNTWLNEVQPIQSVCDMVKELNSCPNCFTVYLVTATNPLNPALREKLLLAQSVTGIDRHHIITCNDKHLLQGHIMIDDYPKNINETTCHLCYLVDRPWNRNAYKELEEDYDITISPDDIILNLYEGTVEEPAQRKKRGLEVFPEDYSEKEDSNHIKGENLDLWWSGDILDVEDYRMKNKEWTYSNIHRLIP